MAAPDIRHDPLLTREQRHAAWEKHNIESILSGLDISHADRFEWLLEAWWDLYEAGLLRANGAGVGQPVAPPDRP